MSGSYGSEIAASVAVVAAVLLAVLFWARLFEVW
jgi:hypothetical protein